MNNPDLNEILNNNIGDLVDVLHEAFKELAGILDLNSDQISELEKDFIARLAFAAIKYGVNKEEEEDCESCPAKDHCLFKEPEKPEKSDGLPDDVINALLYVKRLCKAHKCDDCPFSTVAGFSCRLVEIPEKWEI